MNGWAWAGVGLGGWITLIALVLLCGAGWRHHREHTDPDALTADDAEQIAWLHSLHRDPTNPKDTTP